jgi:hypothetical protein
MRRALIFETARAFFESAGVSRFFQRFFLTEPQKFCGPRFAQPLCQFVTSFKRCSKEVKIKRAEVQSSEELNRGNQKGF